MTEDNFKQQAESRCFKEVKYYLFKQYFFINDHAIAKTAWEQIPCNSFIVVGHVDIRVELVMKEFCTK